MSRKLAIASILCGLTAVTLIAAWWTFRDDERHTLARSLAVGMTEAEVQRIMGLPDDESYPVLLSRDEFGTRYRYNLPDRTALEWASEFPYVTTTTRSRFIDVTIAIGDARSTTVVERPTAVSRLRSVELFRVVGGEVIDMTEIVPDPSP